MKKFLAGTCLILSTLFAGDALFANGIDNLTNVSPEYIRTFSRNASYDTADAVSYNPAGVVKMKDGFYIHGGNQCVFKNYKMGLKSKKLGLNKSYESDKPTLLLPNLHLMYKKENWAAFGSMTIVGGGGGLDYSDGIPLMQLMAMNGLGDKKTMPLPIYGTQTMTVTDVKMKDMELKGNSIYYQGLLGGAYGINDMFSFAAGLRVVNAQKEYKGSMSYTATLSGYDPLYGNIVKTTDQTVKVDTKMSATGVGFMLGTNIAFNEKANMTLKFMSPVSLEFKNETKVDGTGLFPDGKKYHRDLPGYLSAGLGYYVTPDLNLSASFDYFLDMIVDWEGKEDDVRNGVQLGLGAVYGLTPKLKVSGGILFVNNRVGDGYFSDFDYPLKTVTVGTGLMYEVISDLNINLATSRGFYFNYEQKVKDAPASDVKQVYAKSIWVFAFGAQYRI